MFWGLLLLVLGGSIIIEQVLSINIPIARVVFGVFLIYMGFKVIFGSFHTGWKTELSEHRAVFGSSKFAIKMESEEGDNKYETVFGSSTLDLRNIELQDKDIYLKFDTVFGETKVYIPKDLPVVVESNSVFAEVKMPSKNMNAFGQFTYESDAAKEAPFKVYVKANAVFGSIRFIQE